MSGHAPNWVAVRVAGAGGAQVHARSGAYPAGVSGPLAAAAECSVFYNLSWIIDKSEVHLGFLTSEACRVLTKVGKPRILTRAT